MALFADIKTPYVNQVTLKRLLAPEVKKNIFQNIFTRPEEAVTERFSSDTDAAEIQVIRVKPDANLAREIGADVNGDYFNGDSVGQPSTAAYGIRVLTTIDNVKDIPTNAQDMVDVDLAAAELENLSGKVYRNVNAGTIAAQLVKNLSDVAAGTVTDNKVVLGTGASAYKDAIIEAGAKLDDGNIAEGIETYPDKMRAIFVRSDYKTGLYKSGALIIGGSNYAQDIIQRGGLDKDTRPNNISAYLGEVDNMPVYLASAAVWSLAEAYAGVPAGAFDKVKALVVSATGTGRGLAFNAAIKTIDSPAGQGIRIQPKYRFGAACWDALSVVPIITDEFVNPAAANSALDLLAPGSRVTTAPTITVSANGSTLTPTGSAYSGSAGAVVITVPTGAWAVLYDTTDGTVVTDLTSVSAGSYAFYVLQNGHAGFKYTLTLA